MKASASGKLILCGEHAVVYEHPAIAIPVALQTTVTIDERPGRIDIEHDLLSPRDEARIEKALDQVFPDGGFSLSIESDLPVGVGLGSSAALSVAIGRALGLGEEALRARAMDLEREFHGDPSGLDVAVSLRGEAIWYVKGKPMRVVPTPPSGIVVIDSGTSGDTRAMVQRVADQKDKLQDVIDDIGALTHAARAVLEDPVSLGELLTENHAFLRQLGVSTPALDQLVDLALASKAHGAKLSGAGGGGVVLALIDDPAPLLRSAASAGFDAWVVRQPPGA